MALKQFNPPHPGGFIKRVYIEPHNTDLKKKVSANSIAVKLDVSPSTFNRLINEKSDISPEMAIRLSKVLGRTPESWMLMQNNYDLAKAAKSLDLSKCEPIHFADVG